MRAVNRDCSAEALQYMRQALRCRIYAEIQASEPRRNSNKPLQLIEKLFIAKFQQESHLVQMQRKRRASEPYRKAGSGSQPTHSIRIARFSTTVPAVQILNRLGTPQNANTPWKCFWQGYPLNAQQNSTCI